MKKFPERLKDLRLKRGISQNEISRILCINTRSYQRYEHGDSTPSADTLARIAAFFGVPANYLVGIDEDYNSEKSRLLTVFEKLSADNKRTLLEMADFLNSRQEFSTFAV